MNIRLYVYMVNHIFCYDNQFAKGNLARPLSTGKRAMKQSTQFCFIIRIIEFEKNAVFRYPKIAKLQNLNQNSYILFQ